MREKAFCVTCQGEMAKGKTDTEACAIATKPVITCGSDAGCRIDYGTWSANGCVNTCQQK